MQTDESLHHSLKYIFHLFECTRVMLRECGNHTKSSEVKNAISQTYKLIDDETKKIIEFIKTAN